MSTPTIILPFIVLMLGCALNAWINITIKHAPDKVSASRDVKLIFRMVVEWIFGVFVALLLFREITSPEPISRWSVFCMILYSVVLFYAFIVWHLLKILSLIFFASKKHSDAIKQLAGTQKLLADNQRKTIEVMKERK